MLVLVHDTHKSQGNYILYAEGVDGDTTDKCRQHQLNAGLSVLLSWRLSSQATSEILFHIKCCCFCPFIRNLPVLVTVSHTISAWIPSTGWETLKKKPASHCLISLCLSISLPAVSSSMRPRSTVSRHGGTRSRGGGGFVPWGFMSCISLHCQRKHHVSMFTPVFRVTDVNGFMWSV